MGARGKPSDRDGFPKPMPAAVRQPGRAMTGRGYNAALEIARLPRGLRGIAYSSLWATGNPDSGRRMQAGPRGGNSWNLRQNS